MLTSSDSIGLSEEEDGGGDQETSDKKVTNPPAATLSSSEYQHQISEYLEMFSDGKEQVTKLFGGGHAPPANGGHGVS